MRSFVGWNLMCPLHPPAASYVSESECLLETEGDTHTTGLRGVGREVKRT